MTSIAAIIERQCRRWEQQQAQPVESGTTRPSSPPIITVSRETGSRGSYFASRLALRLGYQRMHKEVIDEICASSGYRKRIIESMDGKARSNLEMMVEGLFTGQSVDMGDYARHLYRTIISISMLGGVVVVGRGANFILGPRRGFHIRFVAPLQRRIANLIDYKQLDSDEARDIIEESDNERREFVRKLFDADIDDPRRYDLVINSAYIDVEELVSTVEVAVKGKIDKLTHLHNDARSDLSND